MVTLIFENNFNQNSGGNENQITNAEYVSAITRFYCVCHIICFLSLLLVHNNLNMGILVYSAYRQFTWFLIRNITLMLYSVGFIY